MTTKQELLDKIAELEAKVQELKDDKPKGVPEMGREYWYLNSSTSSIDTWGSCTVDQARLKRGNVYLTEEAVIRADDKRILLKELRDFAGFEPDWSNRMQEKYCLTYSHYDAGGWRWLRSFSSRYGDWPVFKTEGHAAKAIEHFGDRLDLLLS